MTDLAVDTTALSEGFAARAASTAPSGFAARHIGTPREAQATMLAAIGVGSTAELLDRALPEGIRSDADRLALPPAVTEAEALAELRRRMRRRGWRPARDPVGRAGWRCRGGAVRPSSSRRSSPRASGAARA